MSSAIVMCALLACSVCAVSIKWTGIAQDNQWTNHINWSPDQVPTLSDDVTISKGVVLITIPTGANSITMGTDFNNPANVTFFQTFVVGNGGLNIEGNGNVFINAGTANVQGKVNNEGNIFFHSGQLSGEWSSTSRGYLDMSGPAQKVLTGCSLSVAGTFLLSGSLLLNQSSQVVVSSTAALSGNIGIQNGDGSSVLFDTSAGTLTYSGGGTFSIQAQMKIGVFNFQAGNLTIYSAITFVNSFVVPANSYVATVGVAVVSMTAGVSGSGVLSAAGSLLTLGNISFTGALNVLGGNVTFTGGSASIMTVSGGFALINGALAVAQLNLLSGNVAGSSTISAANVYIKSQGLNLDAPLAISGVTTTAGATLIAFGATGSIVFGPNATLNAGDKLTFTGVPGRTVTNNGVLAANYAILFQNINLAGTGSLNIASTVTIATASITQSAVVLSSGGVFKGTTTQITSLAKISGTPGVTATIGTYTFTCPKECDNISTSSTPTSAFMFMQS